MSQDVNDFFNTHDYQTGVTSFNGYKLIVEASFSYVLSSSICIVIGADTRLKMATDIG